ncbi:WYL domain-containing protein [Microcoleus sp. FACHB-1515]|uniref:helix-turn-helix transcriptional regulator n=1 Tax=Cyanophyceae TaxID=3028117 RepID=UPI0016839C01|nr:WYL domain-containing protein [Microcoleus sp. FACHB-1515]MBD2093479.1 WYL domain-containing protein [Microcoleus sp. FACHB-1515]
MGRRGQSITLSISDRDKAQLEQIAAEQGMLWGDRPNISRLVEAIARRELQIGRNNDWSSSRIQALQQARRALIDTGQLLEAEAIAQLLLERTELTFPARSELEQFLGNPPAAWQVRLEQFIRRQQPFQLAYRDAADRLLTFSIYHAQIVFREKRYYLDCWCEETAGNQDIPPLQHNWTLRLDRILDAAVSGLKGEWRDRLDLVDVEMQLFERLAFAYQARSEDKRVEWLPERPQVRRVIRQVSSTFWLFRDILPYGKDCVIISPELVRDRFRQEITTLLDRYTES